MEDYSSRKVGLLATYLTYNISLDYHTKGTSDKRYQLHK